MKRKKVIAIVALALVLALTAGVLAACNSYEWNSIGMGDSSASVVSNGGYYVEQGKYVYFINGYVGSVTSNEWGAAYKQSIMRAELNEDGTVNNDTAQVVVPLSIYNTYASGGFAVYGDWIYYATPNTGADTSGTASTTHTDFMRTRTDGAVTQRIGTVNSRSSQYLFTPTRILYTTDSATVYYFDFSGMSTSDSVDDGKGATQGTLIENATGIQWGYDAARAADAGAQVSDYIFYTETPTGDDSYRHYNNLCAVRYDGTDRRVLATYDTSLGEGDGAANYDKVFTYTLSDIYYESDSTVTLYYTKSIYENGSSTSTGLYANTFDLTEGFSVENEVKLAESAPSAFFPLGMDGGILATVNDKVYLVNDTTDGYIDDGDNANLVINAGEAVTVQAVIDGYVYYLDKAGTALYRINLDPAEGDSVNVKTVIASGVKSDWLALDFAGDRLVFINTDDYDYLHYVDLGSGYFESKMMGKMTAEDAEAKAEAEKEEETAA